MNVLAIPGIQLTNTSVNYSRSLFERWPERKLLSRHARWRKQAKLLGLSKQAKQRLEWIVWYEGKGGRNISLTCRHFGIARKTFHAWLNRFDSSRLASLESKSCAPRTVRQREYSPLQYERIVKLRRAHIRYGKMKLLVLYRQAYPEDLFISSWKIQCIIKKSNLYYNPTKQERANRKRRRSVNKKKIAELKKKKVTGFLLCMDTIVKYWNGQKRYIVTAIDKHSKVAYARMYTTHSSYNTRDFFYRLHYLLDGKIVNVQTDNGSEFHKYFDKALKDFGIDHYWSRPRTPKDNATIERFNRTLQEEFIDLGNMSADTVLFNERLTQWLIEYNFRRPHQTLDYMPPMNFHFKYHKVLPRYPSSTVH